MLYPRGKSSDCPPLSGSGLTIKIQGLINVFSTLLTLAQTTNLAFCTWLTTLGPPPVAHADRL